MRRQEREIDNIDEIEAIISKADVCRIAFADNNEPYIVTMNFGYVAGKDKKLYFHCAAEGKKLEMIRKNNYVCFEFDTDHRLESGTRPCDFGMRYKSVVGRGRISIINDEPEKKVGLDSIMSHYSNTESYFYDQMMVNRVVILRLDILEMIGKQCS